MLCNSRAATHQLIRFRVGEGEYGLDLLKVKEVIRTREVTWPPKTPNCVKGVINLRGDVIPIVDLRERFGLCQRESTEGARVIVVEVEGKNVGLAVDSASQVARIPAERFSDAPSIIKDSTKNFIMSVGRLEDGLVIMLDAGKIFSAEEIEAI